MFGALIGGAGAIANVASMAGQRAENKRFDRRQRRLGQLQSENIGTLQEMAQGRGPSVGRQMLQQGAQMAANQQRAAAASARGGALQQRLAQRTAQMQGAQIAGQAANAAARLGAQEQLQAQQQYGQAINQQRLANLRDQQFRGQMGAANRAQLGDVFGGLMESISNPARGRR